MFSPHIYVGNFFCMCVCEWLNDCGYKELFYAHDDTNQKLALPAIPIRFQYHHHFLYCQQFSILKAK